MEREGTKVDRPVIGIDASRANAANRTGTEWYAYHVIQELKSLIPDSFEVRLYSREPLRDGLEALPGSWRSLVLKWPFRFWTQIRLSWEMFRDPPDLLFVPAHVLPLMLPRRTVITLHDVAFVRYPEAYSVPGRLYHIWSTRRAVKKAVRILTVSRFSRSEIVGLFAADPDSVFVTHLCHDKSRFRPADEDELTAVRGRYGIVWPYFIYVGRLERKKNLAGILAAFREFKRMWPGYGDHRMLLVGKRGHGYGQEMRDPGAAGAEDVVELGYVPPEDMPALVSGAETFVFPTWYEGFGIPVLEAFACGTPVIASDNASVPEVAGDAALYADPGEPAEIARAMHRLVADPALREVMVERGFRRAAEFSWQRTAEETWRVIEGVIRGGV